MFIENETTEFKREYADSVKHTVAAFANTNGGTIYIGVDDDGGVRGVSDADGAALRVTNAIRDSIRPDVTLFSNCRVEKMDGKAVVVVNVQRGSARPYYIAGKGIRPEGVYVRHGASTVPATETAILKMIKETSGDRYEDARALNQRLAFDNTAAYFKAHGVEFGEPQMRTLGFIGDDGTYTNLALLLSEQCVHTVKLAEFDGGVKSVFKDRRELSGSLLNQMEDAYEYIDRRNRTRAEFGGLSRAETRDYPPEAVREALLNAIVHRDYSYAAPTLISVFDDRIEFVTVGGLVKGISLGDVMLGVSVPRNRRLAEVFYRLRLIEAYGTGILKINECYAGRVSKPKVEVSDNAFKVTLPNVNYNAKDVCDGQRYDLSSRLASPMSGREDIVEDLFDGRDFIVRKDVETALGVSQATAILILRSMTESGALVKEGGGKFMRYRLRTER